MGVSKTTSNITTDKGMVIHIKLYDLFESYNGLVIDCRISKSTFLYFVRCFKCNLSKVANAALTIISDVKTKT